MKEEKRYDSFDCLKAICCIGVVLIHFNWPNDFGLGVKAACRFAVPCFFFISGFFSVKNGYFVGRDVFRRKCRHVFSLVLQFTVFYALFFVFYRLCMDPNVDLAALLQRELTLQRLIDFLFINETGDCHVHGWFLFALLYSYAFMSLFSGKKVRTEIVLPTALLLLSALLLLTEFAPALGMNSYIKFRNGCELYYPHVFFLRALPFYLLGAAFEPLAENGRGKAIRAVRWVTDHPAAVLTFAVTGAACGIVEYFRFNSESQFFVGSCLAAISLCLLCVFHPDRKIPFLHHIGRDLSMNIYLYHIACYEIIDLAARRLQLLDNTVYILCRPFAVLALSLLVAELLYRCKKARQREKIITA